MDLSVLEQLRNVNSLEEAANLLHRELGLERPPSKEVTKKAISNPSYARALVLSQNVPELLSQLLAQPSSISVKASEKVSTSAVVKNAASSLLKWGMKGLKPAQPWVIARRLEACNSCEYQSEAPDALVYRGAKVFVGKNAKVCVICNCLTNTKAAISTEHCPEKSTDNPNVSRWGEPWLPKEHHPKGPW